METVGVTAIRNFGDFAGCRVLVTGHTGFKGSWLALWLQRLGAEVVGISLEPETRPSHWSLLDLAIESHISDIRDTETLSGLVRAIKPELVFHLAAQPLVRRSYREPLDTWSTNVMGTANLLEAIRETTSTRAIVAVTTDKCYLNREWVWGYRENDRLGGHDPYSASKAATEILVDSYRRSFLQGVGTPLLATARAGNVIGGGDWSEDRLIPDAVRAVVSGKELIIRSPKAVRPWQHVLDCLHGYLLLALELLAGNTNAAKAWNFGPETAAVTSVESVLDTLADSWPALNWRTEEAGLHETKLLQLDSSMARCELGWVPVWNTEQAVRRTAAWYRDYVASQAVISIEQLEEFQRDCAIACKVGS